MDENVIDKCLCRRLCAIELQKHSHSKRLCHPICDVLSGSASIALLIPQDYKLIQVSMHVVLKQWHIAMVGA